MSARSECSPTLILLNACFSTQVRCINCRYCSDRCRRSRGGQTPQATHSATMAPSAPVVSHSSAKAGKSPNVNNTLRCQDLGNIVHLEHLNLEARPRFLFCPVHLWQCRPMTQVWLLVISADTLALMQLVASRCQTRNRLQYSMVRALGFLQTLGPQLRSEVVLGSRGSTLDDSRYCYRADCLRCRVVWVQS